MRSSIARRRGAVDFPAPILERHYMVPFTRAAGLPAHLRHWQRTVDQMLEGAEAPGRIYFMVDSGQVPAGAMLRRPGLHVDGHWLEHLRCHAHRQEPGPRRAPGPRGVETGEHSPLSYPEAIILASDVTGCEAFTGPWEADVADDGEISSLDRSGMQHVVFEAGFAYAGNAAGMVHRSVPMQQECFRRVVRLNVQGWEPSAA